MGDEATPYGDCSAPVAGPPDVPPPGIPAAPVMPPAGGGGIQGLMASNKFVIKQKMSKMEVAGDIGADAAGCPCCGELCETVNTYAIYNEAGQKVFKMKEDSGACCRVCCNPSHQLRLKMKDPESDEVLMTIDRPFKCHPFCPAWLGCCQQEATLYRGEYKGEDATPNAQVMGFVQQPCCGGVFSPELETMDRPDGEVFAKTTGPTCCFGGLSEGCCDQVFEVNNGGQIVKEKPETAADIMKELMSDADIFTLKFNPGAPHATTAERRAAMLATLLLLDYMFFEQDKPWEFRWGGEDESCYCNCTCCYWYLCGAYLPIKVKCPPCGGLENDDEQ